MISAEPIEETRPTSVHDSNEENNAEQRYLVHFAITDTGPGISPERQAALFEAFTQADTTVSRRYGGTGLGLSISKRLTELLGGTIWVESAGLGQGSTFHFTMNAAGWSDPKWDILKKPAARLVGKKVLLIHQHLTGWSQIYTQAKTWGMIPIDLLIDTTTPTLPEPLTDFDMIMLDQQLLERLKPWLQRLHEATQSTFSPPLVLVTPVGGCDEAVRASLEAVCLTKPIKFKELYQVFTTVGGRLPLQAAAEQASPAKEGLLTGQIHPLRILLAEDNKVNQKVALRLLKQLGYQADVAINGLEVLQLIDQKRYDVILMDIQMPEMDGLEATRQIKTRLVSRDWPRIIALTANALTDDRQKYLNAGMDDYLSKPFRAAELEALLLACPSLTDKPQIP
jgi:CheY-like chemotaxis protein